MVKVNIFKIIEQEQKHQMDHIEKISKMRHKDFVLNVFQDFCASMADDIISKVDNTDDYNYDYRFDIVSLGIERFLCSNERKKEYYQLLETRDSKIRDNVINIICKWLKKRERIDVVIDEYIKEYLSSKLSEIDIIYNKDNSLISKIIFYKVLTYYDTNMIYECGLCDIDIETDERAFLISTNEKVKKKMADTIFDDIKKEIDDYLTIVNQCDDYSYEEYIQDFDNVLNNQDY